MTTGEIIQRIQSLYSKGVESDDSRLTNRHIYNKLLSVRSKLISQQAKKRQKISQWNYQTLPCVELIEVAPHQCPCLPVAGCTMFRTLETLPKILTDLNRHLLQSVTSVTGDYTYSETTFALKKYKKGNKYTSEKPDYFIYNDYLWITQKN